jgi:predicted secreted protein
MKRLACVIGSGTRTALVLTLLLALPALGAGCGSVGRPGGGSAAQPSPSAPSSPGANRAGPAGDPAVGLTEADSGRTFQIHKGDRLSIALREPAGFSPWSRLASSDGTVLLPVVDTRAAAVRGVTIGSFQAVAPGTAQLTSSATQDCPQGAACTALAKGWTITVLVS